MEDNQGMQSKHMPEVSVDIPDRDGAFKPAGNPHP